MNIEIIEQELQSKKKKDGGRVSARFSIREDRLLLRCQSKLGTNVTDTIVHALIALWKEINNGTK